MTDARIAKATPRQYPKGGSCAVAPRVLSSSEWKGVALAMRAVLSFACIALPLLVPTPAEIAVKI